MISDSWELGLMFHDILKGLDGNDRISNDSQSTDDWYVLH